MIAAFCIGEETQNFFAVSLSHNLRFTGVQGRFLASLEMTIRGQPSTRRDERGCEIARPPVSSSKAEPRDLNVIAAFCIGEEMQKFFCRIVISQSLLYRCARKISRFARNDDMGGMMGCGGAVFSFPYPRRLVANYFPLFLRTFSFL